MERSNPEARAGKIWVRRAVAGRCGRGKSPVCVEEMVLPSGKVTCTGLKVGVKSVQGPSIIMKWPLHPLSAMACVEFVGGGAE